jgi:transmembrane sensor
LRRTFLGLAATVLLSLIVWGVVWRHESPTYYTTALGERRIVMLGDGSRVSLDADSAVSVRYTSSARLLKLLRGQARFDVYHDVERPFSVLAGTQKVIATGTAFNINLDGQRVSVTLIEGHVVVVDEKLATSMGGDIAAEQHHRSIELHAGERLSSSPEKGSVIEKANIPQATAWMNGQLLIDNEPLSQVVSKVNRYTSTEIQIRDRDVASMRISGIFNTGDIEGVLDLVTHYLPVRAVKVPGGNIVLERKPKNT